MSDDDIIPKLNIPQKMTAILDNLPEPYLIRDVHSRNIYANKPMLSVYNLGDKSELVGKLDSEINSPLVKYDNTPDEWVLQDRYVRNARQRMSFLEVHPKSMDYPYIITRLPYYNEQLECEGTICFIDKLKAYSVDDFVTGDMPTSLLLQKPDDFFTEKECEIMFFRIQGMKSKTVANRLGMSENTICNYMQSLYYKTGARHLDDFREFCKRRNYHRYLPKRFLSKHISGYSNLIT